LYAVNPESGVVRTIVAPSPGRYRGLGRWSPDGTQMAYSEWVDATTWTVRIRVVAADGTGDRLLAKPADAVWESVLGWSNDGTRLVAVRGYSGSEQSGRAVVIPADGSGFGVEIENSGFINPGWCSSWEWAPDDSTILAVPPNVLATAVPLMIDPATGTARSAGWTTTSCPTWQRLAP
jgi:Tol biopolymer transport system component